MPTLAQLRDNDLLVGEEARRSDSERIRKREARVKLRLEKLNSGMPTFTRQSVQLADERIAQAIHRAKAHGDEVILLPNVGAAVEDYRSLKRKPRSTAHDPSIPRVRQLWTPHWDHTGDRLKALSWVMAMEQANGVAFSLHLNEELVTKLQLRGPGLAQRLRDRLSRYLRRRPQSPIDARPIEFFFWIEATPNVAPHIHGVIAFHPNDQPEVAKALMAAGGPYGARQLDLSELFNARGWLRYITKCQLSTSIGLGDKNIFAATNGVRRQAKD